MANLVELGSLNIAAGYCSIEVSDGEHSESIVIDAEGRAYWRRGDQERAGRVHFKRGSVVGEA